MEAAFVDIGTPKNAVLYRGDVQYDPEDIEERSANMRIEQMLKAKQTIICQVTKNPIGAKGARLTQEVSLPGRFVVLIPNSTTYGISKRLSDEERKRLRSILDKVKPKQHGVIVRTAAEKVTSEEIERDVLRLLKQWEQIDALAKRSQAPALLYREPDMAVRVIREEFNNEYRGVVIDDPELFEDVRDYVASISPALADRVELFDRAEEPLPLFERFHVHEQLHKALDRKVWLPSGGSLIIEHTEALTVIDVNTGKKRGHVEPRGDGVSQQPRGGGRSRPAAPVAGHRRHHRRGLHRHGDTRQPRAGDPRLPRGPGPGQDAHAGLRHLRARPGRDDPKAHRRGPARIVHPPLSAM